MTDLTINVTKDSATGAVQQLRTALTLPRLQRAVGSACALTVRNHLLAKGPNKRGWPSTGFYKQAALGVDWKPDATGVTISVDNEAKPGAMRQRYHGGTIRKKDKLLTIPARAEFYGKKATDFDNLRFGMFKSGTKFLYINLGGTGLVDFATGKSRAVKGAGARAEMMVAYWLKDEVTQAADPSVLPTNDQLVGAALGAVMDEVRKATGQ